MRIMRRGARADHGLRYVEIKKMKHRWNPTSEAFESSSTNAATDFATDARHNYTVRRDLTELAQEIQVLGDECKNIDSDGFADAFGPVLPALHRIIARASQTF